MIVPEDNRQPETLPKIYEIILADYKQTIYICQIARHIRDSSVYIPRWGECEMCFGESCAKTAKQQSEGPLHFFKPVKDESAIATSSEML